MTRPLAIPNNAMGVLSHVGVYNDIAMRVSMQYSIANGGTVVNLDILAGVAVLDDRPLRRAPGLSRQCNPPGPAQSGPGGPLKGGFGMDMTYLWPLLKQYGPLAMVVAFFLWQNWLRELRMSDRITKLEDEQREVLLADGRALHGRNRAEHGHDGAVGKGPGRPLRVPAATQVPRRIAPCTRPTRSTTASCGCRCTSTSASMA